MAFPGWLMALSTTLGGMQQQQQQQQKQKQRQQMIQALLGQRAQQNPGGIGAMGPQNWGANNTSQGGVIRDQWGNPIGPAGAPADGGGSPAAPPPVAQATDVFSGGASATPFAGGADMQSPMPPNMYPSVNTPATTSAVPFMGGPSQATPPQGTGGYQAPIDPMDEAVMNALFAPQGA